MLDDCVVLYLDNILTFKLDVAIYCKALRAVFERLAKHQLYLRPEKCALFLSSVEFFGHILDALGVHVQQAKINVIKLWPVPLCLLSCSNCWAYVTTIASLLRATPTWLHH